MSDINELMSLCASLQKELAEKDEALKEFKFICSETFEDGTIVETYEKRPTEKHNSIGEDDE